MIITDEKILRQVSEEVKEEDVSKIIEDMKLEAKNAGRDWAGISAIQLGIPKRIIMLKDKYGDISIHINPEIDDMKEDTDDFEQCLSVPGKSIMIRRKKFVKLHDKFKKDYLYEGIMARAVQHEIDHLNGVLITDYQGKGKIDRNKPCPCGSGKKYKKCCGR